MSRITINRGQILRNDPCTSGLACFDRNFPGVSDRKRFTIQQLLDARIPAYDIVWALRCVAPIHRRKIREAAKEYLPSILPEKRVKTLTPCLVWFLIAYDDYPQYLRTLMNLDEEQDAH